jgi:hypothetical protein
MEEKDRDSVSNNEISAKLTQSIDNKIEDWDRTRHNRIRASKRLNGYDEKWSVLMLFMNTVAVIFLFISFTGNSNIVNSMQVISACYSAYVIIVQYFLSTKDYSARSLKLHYEQLEIETLRSNLRSLEFDQRSTTEEKELLFQEIILRYQTSLAGAENHISLDNERANQEKAGIRISHDFTLDNLLIYANATLLGVIIFVIGLNYVS